MYYLLCLASSSKKAAAASTPTGSAPLGSTVNLVSSNKSTWVPKSASAWLWHWAQELELVEIVDRHVPAVDKKHRSQLSVGHYLTLAAINRAIEARSKRSFYTDWYQDSVVSRLCPAPPGALSSQRFWDHMDQVETAHIDAIQQDLLGKLRQLFPLGQETLLYDTTNYFTFIDTLNDRCQLAQRGNNKQKRHDLRQLSLAHLGASPMHYVGSIPGHWVADLLDIDLESFERLALPGTKHLKVHRCRYPLWEKQRTLLVVFSPSFYRRQRAAMNRLQQKVTSQLVELAGAIEKWNQRRRGSGFRVESVRKKIHEWTARDHLREFLHYDLRLEQEKVIALNWYWDRRQKRAVQRRYLGKTVLFTDQPEWKSTAIVAAYRRGWPGILARPLCPAFAENPGSSGCLYQWLGRNSLDGIGRFAESPGPKPWSVRHGGSGGGILDVCGLDEIPDDLFPSRPSHQIGYVFTSGVSR